MRKRLVESTLLRQKSNEVRMNGTPLKAAQWLPPSDPSQYEMNGPRNLKPADNWAQMIRSSKRKNSRSSFF
jgi:hypothetical protein